jgi:sec-independent protein translocase protein TatC
MALFGNKKGSGEDGEMSFLDHIEVLRWHLVRSAAVILFFAIVAFSYPEIVFDKVIFGPKRPDFPTYKVMCDLGHKVGAGDQLCMKELKFQIINTDLSGQFTTHLWIAILTGIICGFPYLLWELWRFIKPALKGTESKPAASFIISASFLFIFGVLFAYYVIVPLSVNFLATYQASSEITNMPSMDSYISLVSTLVLATGLVFELPILVYFLSRLGIITPKFMRTYRRHAVVVILIVGAVITPSPDITSQMLVAVPLYGLYELSIFVSRYVVNKYKLAENN